ncbi:putative oxidoreductase TDA3 [Yarrowia sp. C11]|nr:putative oxidoreductase TDA3 [Yarrowia sp. E02]KAG5373095.1 putative oxidoreductase TDA3 [Yarrowia sp. C11]
MSEKEEIVIVGAGIIGVCTAYYLLNHPKFDPKKHHITIIEAVRAAGGASGKAGGLLALWAFPSQIVPMSFALHEKLADKYNGTVEWGYRRVSTVSVEGNLMKTGPAPLGRKVAGRAPTHSSEKGPEVDLPEDLDWIRPEVIDSWSHLGGTDATAQVHPFKFTTFILKKVLESGHATLVLGSVKRVNTRLNDDDEEEAISVTYTASPGDERTIAASKVVLAVGPWTSKLLPTCPISGLRAHSITIVPTKPTTAYGIFTELRVSRNRYVSPEIYARKDEIYVCGEGDSLPVPENTDAVEVERERCDELFKWAGDLSHQLKNGKVLKRQACYLPVVDVPSCTGPLIGETTTLNLFLASGHSCWGINNAPGTGLLIAELLLDGEATSADISQFDPKLYFDSSEL